MSSSLLLPLSLRLFLLVLCLSLFPIQQHLSNLYSYVPYTSTEKIVTFSGFTGIAHREEHGAEMCPNKFEQYYHTFLQGLERNQHHPPLLNAIPGSVRFLNIMFMFSSFFLICIVGVNETKTLRSIITRSMTQKKIKYFFIFAATVATSARAALARADHRVVCPTPVGNSP